MKYWLQLEAQTPQIDWSPEDDLMIRDVRQIKSERELSLFREAGELVTRAHIGMMESLIIGKTEYEPEDQHRRLSTDCPCNVR